MNNVPVGIVGLGVYLPDTFMTAKEISEATGGTWSEDAVINKLGIRQKRIPSDKPATALRRWARSPPSTV